MLDKRNKLAAALALLLVIANVSPIIATPIAPVAEGKDAVQSTPKEQLQAAEQNYRDNKIDDAVTQATHLIETLNKTRGQNEQLERDATADLVLFQLKAGHPDESARLLRMLLLDLQLELPMDPSYATNQAELYSQSPKMLKDYFGKEIERLNESAATHAIIDSLIDNTVPKDYLTQLKSYFARLNAALNTLEPLQSVADGEALKYGDPLQSLTEDRNSANVDSTLNVARLEKLGEQIESAATEAQQMPVGDARAALGLYQLALIANSAQFYPVAEKFARDSISHMQALTDNIAGYQDVQIALAYALLKQEGKTADFKALRDDIVKTTDGRERMLVSMARFTEATNDGESALALYKQALDNRAKMGTSQAPEWIDDYNSLVKKLHP